MTDVLELAPPDVDHRVRPGRPAVEPTAPAPRKAPTPTRNAMRVGAALSASAGAIHLVMVPSHYGESVAEGIGFAASGWFQLLVAGLFLARPSRHLAGPVAFANAAFIGAWAWSRTAGLPFGDHAGHPETAGFVDLTTVGLEVALILWCAVAAFGPARTRRGGRRTATVVVAGAFVLTTMAIASPSARNHAAHSHGETAADGHDHGAEGATAGVAADGHDHATDAAPVDDRGLSALSNGHHHEIGPEERLDAATRADLSHEIALTQQVAALLPTVADAEAAGYYRAGPYAPGLGAHYVRPSAEGLNGDGVMDDADLLAPLSIIYAGTAPDSPVAGFMYYATTTEEPAGFAGPNDHWHYHTNTCIKPSPGGGIDAPFGADTEVSAELCEGAGGFLLEQTQWMVHVWSVAGWESQQGLFGEVNPALSCPDGSYYMVPLEEYPDHPLDVCAS